MTKGVVILKKRKRISGTKLERAKAAYQRMYLARLKKELVRQDEILEMLQAIMARLKLLTLSLSAKENIRDAERTN